jgi:hypothetical protein
LLVSSGFPILHRTIEKNNKIIKKSKKLIIMAPKDAKKNKLAKEDLNFLVNHTNFNKTEIK